MTILLESTVISNSTFDEIVDDRLNNFLREKCADCENFEDLTEAINSVEVKHSARNEKMSKFTQNIYAYVYSRLIDFPERAISYETVTTTNFFQNIDRIVKKKVHLDHSHGTGEILGYMHDFT